MDNVWNRLINMIIGPLPKGANTKDRSRLLAMNGFALVIVIISIAYSFVFYVLEQSDLFRMVIGLGLLCTIPPVLNYLRVHKISRYYYVFQGSFFVLVYALFLGRGSAINYFFILLFVFPFVFLKPQEMHVSIIYFCFNFSCLLYYEYATPPIVEPVELSADVQWIVKGLVLSVLFIYLVTLFILFHQVIIKNEQVLIQTNKETQKANQIKQDFLAVMSHELRTPLNAVISITNLLNEELNEKEREHFMKILKFSGDNLLSIVNDILDFSKLEAQKMRLDMRPHPIREVLQNCINTYQHLAEEKNLSYEFELDSRLNNSYIFDDVKLSQILGNLLSNAIKYTTTGGVHTAIRLKHRIEYADIVEFKVRDTGQGVSEESLSEIFTSFTQLKGALKRTEGGTGLGLAIVKRLLHLYKSEIYVESALLQGSTFRFEIVLKRSSKLPPQVRDQGSQFKGKKILLVEDNAINAIVAEKLLQTWGMDITIAANGKVALDLCADCKYDLVFMDIHMPVMDGYEAAETLRKQDGVNKFTPIIALTADITSESNLDFHHYFDGFLTKPIEKRKLQKELANKLGS